MLEKIKKYKGDIVLYILILSFSIIMCHNFLQMHYSSDTWVVIDKGYTKYALEFFMGDARIFSSISMFIADFFNINIEIFVIGMDLLAIIISSISVLILYKFFVKILNIKDKVIYKYLTLIGCYLIIFSHMSIEYFLFAESAIMCLSILFNIISTILLHSDKKCKEIKSLIFLLLATFCYQGNLGIFVVINILIIFIKQQNIKQIIKAIIKILVVYALSCLINIIVMKLINNLFLGQEQYRITISINLLDKFYRAISNFNKGFIYSFGFIYPYTNIIIIVITLVLMITLKCKIRHYIQYVVLVLTGIFMCLYYDIFTTNIVYFQSRVCTAIGILWGIYVIYLINISSKKEKSNNFIVALITCFSITLLLYTSYTYIRLSDNHIYSNNIYIETGNIIKKKVEEYEVKTGKTVKYVSFYNDKTLYVESLVKDIHVYPLPRDVLNIGSLTENPMYKAYSYTEYLRYFLQRDFEYKNIENSVYLEKFKDCDWDTIDETQIYVDNETVYIATY